MTNIFRDMKLSEILTSVSLIVILAASCITYSYKLGKISNQFQDVSVKTKLLEKNSVRKEYVEEKFDSVDSIIQEKVDITLYKTEMEQIKKELKENRQDHILMSEKLDKILERVR